MNTTIIDIHSHLPAHPEQISRMLFSARKNMLKYVFVSTLSLGTEHCVEFPAKGEVAAANKHTFKYCEKYPDILKGYVYLNPCLNWKDELMKWVKHPAFTGIKLWISLKDDTGSPDICIPVLQAASELQVPVLIHSFYRSSENKRGELDPSELVSLARSSPGTDIIMAHLGGNWEKGCQAVKSAKNISVDISGFPAYRGSVEYAIKICGSSRVLFGADVPCRTFQSQIAKVYMSETTENIRAHIMSLNALRLYKTVFERI